MLFPPISDNVVSTNGGTIEWWKQLSWSKQPSLHTQFPPLFPKGKEWGKREQYDY